MATDGIESKEVYLETINPENKPLLPRRLVVPDLYKIKMNCQTVRTFQHLLGHVLTREVCQYLSGHIRSFQGLSAGFSACQGL